MKIDAYVVEEINAPFVRETLELDEPGPGEVLVKVKAVGVCHTDLNTQSGDMPLPLPGVFRPVVAESAQHGRNWCVGQAAPDGETGSIVCRTLPVRVERATAIRAMSDAKERAKALGTIMG